MTRIHSFLIVFLGGLVISPVSHSAASQTELPPYEKFIQRDLQKRKGVESKDDMVRVLIQPNGWGHTPERAIADLERVMRIYQDKPGFIRHPYKKVIHFSRNLYQCDGQCSYLVKRGLRPSNPRKGASNYLKKTR